MTISIENNPIVDSIENSLNRDMKSTAKFQNNNRPTGKVFNPTAKFRKEHLAAKPVYVQDVTKQDSSEVTVQDDINNPIGTLAQLVIAWIEYDMGTNTKTMLQIASELNVPFNFVQTLYFQHRLYIKG